MTVSATPAYQRFGSSVPDAATWTWIDGQEGGFGSGLAATCVARPMMSATARIAEALGVRTSRTDQTAHRSPLHRYGTTLLAISSSRSGRWFRILYPMRRRPSRDASRSTSVRGIGVGLAEEEDAEAPAAVAFSPLGSTCTYPAGSAKFLGLVS